MDSIGQIMGLRGVSNSLIGTALGDSLGLVFEGMAAKRVERFQPLPLRQRMVARYGMVSDDTHLSVIAAIAMLSHPTDPGLASVHFARNLKRWFWTLPPGVGLSTLKACLKLSLGVKNSGVCSAGNGAAMRVAFLGALFRDNHDLRDEFVEALSRVTHTHPLAITGAKLVAVAAAFSAQGIGPGEGFDAFTRSRYPDWDFAATWPDRGPSGYVVHTVQAALEVWRTHPQDLVSALGQCVQMGGDTDSVAAIVGGIIGAGLDKIEVSQSWYQWVGWPSVEEITDVSAESNVPFLRLLLGHLVGMLVVLAHGFRRLAPPY